MHIAETLYAGTYMQWSIKHSECAVQRILKQLHEAVIYKQFHRQLILEQGKIKS